MKYKLFLLAFAILGVSLFPVQSWAGQNDAKELSWQEAVQKENHRVNSQGSSSVLGASVGESIRRISEQAKAAKQMEAFFKGKKNLSACQARYNTLQNLVTKNKLFGSYVLSAVEPNDLCKMSAKGVALLEDFFKGAEAPQEAVLHGHTIVLSFNYQEDKSTLDVWLVVKPSDKVISFIYNDPMPLTWSDEITKNKGKHLIVK